MVCRIGLVLIVCVACVGQGSSKAQSVEAMPGTPAATVGGAGTSLPAGDKAPAAQAAQTAAQAAQAAAETGQTASEAQPGWNVMGFFVGQGLAPALEQAKASLSDLENRVDRGYFSGKGKLEGAEVQVHAVFGRENTLVELNVKVADIPGSQRATTKFETDPLTLAVQKMVGASPSWDVAEESNWNCPGAFFARANWTLGDAILIWQKEWSCAKGEPKPTGTIFTFRAYSKAWADSR